MGLARLIAPAAKEMPQSLAAAAISRGGTPPQRGTTEILRAYSTMPWLRAVVQKVAKSVGSTTWRLFVVRGGDGRATSAPWLQRAGYAVRRRVIDVARKQGTLEEIEAHPLLDLLAGGNEKFSGGMVVQLTQAHLDLVGEAFWLIERNRAGKPAALWPLPPDWVRGTPAPGRGGLPSERWFRRG